jgi:short-subunit dehydrogenase
MKDLRDKTVVITGAANGLGKALAKAFYRHGSQLALIDIDMNGLESLKKELEKEDQLITIYQADISSEEQVSAVKRLIVEQHKGVDILVNNAGISISQLFNEVAISDFRKLIDVNFWGTVLCSRYFMPDLLAQSQSHLVNIISGFALLGFPGKTCYGSSKSAIMGFSNALKTEISHTTLRISLVIPPALDTGLVWGGPHMGEDKRQKEAVFMKKNAMPIEKAAEKIIRGIRKGKYRIVAGRMMFWTDLAARIFPTRVHEFIGRNKRKYDFV